MPLSPEIIGTKLRENSTVDKQYQYPSERPKYYMNIMVTDYVRTGAMTVGLLNPIANFVLPLPSPLMDQQTVTYTEDKHPLLGGAINAIDNMYGKMRPNTVDFGAMNNAGAAASALGKGDFRGAIEAAKGVASNLAHNLTNYVPNQFMTVLLQGPTYKRHEFRWKLSPKSPKEAETLRLIIKNLHNWAAPGLTLGGFLFTFPKIFYVAFVPNPKYMYKFKPMVIEAFTADYTPGQQPAFHTAHKDTDNLNAPEGVDIALRMLELEYWLQDDANDTNFPFDSTRTGVQVSDPPVG